MWVRKSFIKVRYSSQLSAGALNVGDKRTLDEITRDIFEESDPLIELLQLPDYVSFPCTHCRYLGLVDDSLEFGEMRFNARPDERPQIRSHQSQPGTAARKAFGFFPKLILVVGGTVPAPYAVKIISMFHGIDQRSAFFSAQNIFDFPSEHMGRIQHADVLEPDLIDFDICLARGI